MPHLPEDYVKQAEKITTAFLGDPSFFAYNGEEPEPEDPEAPPVERFREVHRLAWTVQKIDHDCALVPRGAISVDASKKVISSSSYQGLSFDTSLELRAYLHFRRPENIQGQALLKRPGIIKTDDFLDCIDKDTPKGKDNRREFLCTFILIVIVIS
jgi:radial spoke head protein 9